MTAVALAAGVILLVASAEGPDLTIVAAGTSLPDLATSVLPDEALR